jgi:uncharacterized membrane protein
MVLSSPIAQGLPIPDASLGAAAYLADLILGSIGGADRWRTMPWLVIAFGTVVALAGLASLLLVAAQALVVHAWCTLCLASAVISLSIVPLAAPEVLASVRCLEAAASDFDSERRSRLKKDKRL